MKKTANRTKDLVNPTMKTNRTKDLVNLTMKITQQEHDSFKILAVTKSMSMTELFRTWLEKALKSAK